MSATSNTVTPIYRGDEALRAEVRTMMEADQRLSQVAVSKEAGLSASALNQWLSVTYKGDNEAVDAKLRMWLEAYRARVAAGDQLPEAPDYVDTPTASRMMAALGYAQVAGDIAVAYGAAGLGKSTACRRYRDSHPNVWMATMDPSCAGGVTSLQEICDALDLAEMGGARTMSRAITKRVRGTHGLLVIDEAQWLSVAALEQIRSIHDATGLGIALVGNEGVYARMAGGRNAQQLDRLYSRIGKRLALRRSSDGDIKAIVAAWGIEDSKCLPTMLTIARGIGGLRTLTKVLRLASMQAVANGRGVCCQDVRAASRELGGVA